MERARCIWCGKFLPGDCNCIELHNPPVWGNGYSTIYLRDGARGVRKLPFCNKSECQEAKKAILKDTHWYTEVNSPIKSSLE
jgi:hypothetical protein